MKLKKRIGLFLQRLGNKLAGKRLIMINSKCRLDGKVLWEERKVLNALQDEGEANILNSYFRAVDVPITFYLRLANQVGDPAETDALADLVEASGGSYAGQEITRDATGFPTLELNAGDYQLVSKEVSFVASGGSFTATHMYLATTVDDSGKFVSWIALSTTRTIPDGAELLCTMTCKLS